MKKILLILTLIILPFWTFADEYQTNPIENVNEPVQVEGNSTANENISTDKNVSTGGNIQVEYTGNILTNTTVDDLGNKVIDKLNDVVDLLKKIAAPLSIITFIIGVIFMVFGAFGKRDGIKQGVVIAILSILMYSLCMYAGPIISAVHNWIIS